MAGLDFARNQLEKQGWTEGKGLGKGEDGISKAIKVGIKNDTQGVGYKISDQFTFHWWDHVFNKTAKSIVVKENEDGVDVTKDSSSNQPISNKRPNKHSKKPLLYGRFVKASSTARTEDSGSESESDVEAEKDFSSSHPEDIVFKACGGRTAHKGARHGLSLNGKLKRIEEHDKVAMSAPCSRSGSPNVTKAEHDIEGKTAKLLCQLKSKKKRKSKAECDVKSYSDSEGCVVKKEKKRKRTVEELELENKEERFLMKKKKNKSACDDELSEERKKKKKKKDGKRKDKISGLENLDSNKNEKKKSLNLNDDERCLESLEFQKESDPTRTKKEKVKLKKHDKFAVTEEKKKRKTKRKRKAENEDKIKTDKDSENEETAVKKKKKTRRKK